MTYTNGCGSIKLNKKNILKMEKINNVALRKNKKAAIEVCKKLNIFFFEMINDPKY